MMMMMINSSHTMRSMILNALVLSVAFGLTARGHNSNGGFLNTLGKNSRLISSDIVAASTSSYMSTSSQSFSDIKSPAQMYVLL